MRDFRGYALLTPGIQKYLSLRLWGKQRNKNNTRNLFWIRLRTKAGDVSVEADVLQVPLSRLGLQGVALAHVVHGEHRFLTELGVVVEIDFGVKANHCWERSGEEHRRQADKHGELR